MKHAASLVLGLALLAACDPDESPRPKSPTSDSGILVGTWTFSHSGRSGGFISKSMTMNSNGTYSYESLVTPGGGSFANDLETKDAGMWELKGDVVTYRSQSGEVTQVQVQVDPSGALHANGELWLRQP